jgi:manganese efflux pump family protein
MLRLLVLVLPLSLDSFAVALAVLGGSALTRSQRLRAMLLFAMFEAGMPLVGLALGAPLASRIGSLARFLVPGVLAALGIWLLYEATDDDDAEARKASSLVTARGLAVIGLAIGISMDEVAVGFTMGVSKLPVARVVIAIAVQACLAVQAGSYLGDRLAGLTAARIRGRSERLAGMSFVGVAAFLLFRALVA